MAAVKFVTATAAKFGALEPDANTLYFITDEQRLYKGKVPFSGGIYETVTADPEAPFAKNTLFVNTVDGSVKFSSDGTVLTTVVKPQPAAINGAGSAAELATTKAVVDYIAAKIKEVNAANQGLDTRLTAVEKKANDNETAIGVINGDGAGSITKAVSDAKTELQGKIDAAKTELQGEIDQKATKATTLAGYGIEDAFTKDETTSAINAAVANAHHLKREVVAELPEISAANEDTIYMVPKKTGAAGNAEGNAYIEYMLINGKFEQIGDSTVDLTDYATKTYAESQATEKANKALEDAKADSLAKIQALDKTDTAAANQYVSAVSQTDGLISVSRVTLPVYSVTTGTADGTIAVNGTDVKVHGLGSAAFAETTDFDAKGAADTAAADALVSAKSYADEAKQAAIDTASADATAKANAAQTAAINSAATDATKKADAAQAAAEATAAADATSKANQAKADAIAAAKTETTTQVSAAKEAAAADATTKADAARDAAKEYADGLLSWEDLG